jgi:hypothetical protein
MGACVVLWEKMGYAYSVLMFMCVCVCVCWGGWGLVCERETERPRSDVI